jgi:hypothetical protein
LSEATLTLDAALPPIDTAVTPVRFVPAIVTIVPPATGPEEGDIDVIVGMDTGPEQAIVTALI